jgi:hypothetical protein
MTASIRHALRELRVNDADIHEETCGAGAARG